MIGTMPGVDKDKLFRLRLNRAWTQERLAKEAGVSPSTVVLWEKGRGERPHPSTLDKLATALEVKPSDLLDG